MALEFVMSKRGFKKLIYNGFMHFEEKRNVSLNRVYWKCCDYKVTHSRCSGRVITEGDEVIQFSNHSHPGDPADVRKEQFMNQIKNVALVNTEKDPSTIIVDELSDLPENVQLRLAKRSSIKRNIRRVRSSNKVSDPSVPQNISDFIVPDELQITVDNKRFLLHDSGNDDSDRILAFSTAYNLRVLSRADYWLADGTFDFCPTIFSQIYTIHVLVENSVFPLVYALLPSKTEAVYKRLLQILKSLQPNLDPKFMMLDFELAFSNAAEHEFEELQIKFCFFHFRQALYRNIGALGLKQRYDTDNVFNLKIKCLAALAFLPIDKVKSSYDSVVMEMFADETETAVDDFLLYFQKNYVGINVGPRVKRPRFEIIKWNQYEAVVNNLPKTNNSLEGWHRGFQFNFRKTNHSIYDVIRAFKADEVSTKQAIAQRRSQADPEPQRKKYASYNRRIRAIVANYNSNLYRNDEMQYIKDIAGLLGE